MLKGIDISNWQAGLNINNLDIDFVIVKATEGIGFVDWCCDEWIQQAKEKGIKWGFYHFANNNDPITEAEFFVENCRDYFGYGIPVLDIEDNNISNWGLYAELFTRRVHELTNVYPMIYTSAYALNKFAGYECVDNCGLWCAGYPYPYPTWTNDEFPYDYQPWDFVAIWQFTSSLCLTGYNGNLDGDYAYMDSNAWDKYAGAKHGKPSGETSPEPTRPVLNPQQVVNEVILGKWGNGDVRKHLLTDSGYNYDDIQNEVNRIYAVADDVIRGSYGVGQYRYDKLAEAGYDPNIVQLVVNDKLYY